MTGSNSAAQKGRQAAFIAFWTETHGVDFDPKLVTDSDVVEFIKSKAFSRACLCRRESQKQREGLEIESANFYRLTR
jgi:hypothetical protein